MDYEGRNARFWYTLLRRYVRHMIELEGVVAVNRFFASGSGISEEEWDELEKLGKLGEA